MIDYKIVLIIF